MRDYYYILGVDEKATEQEIKSAYRKLSIKFHPDKNDGEKFFEERFKAIQEAYETLSNASKRNDYDLKLKSFKNGSGNDFEKMRAFEQALKKKFEEEFRKWEADKLRREKEFQEKTRKAEEELKRKQAEQTKKEEELKSKFKQSEEKLKQEYQTKLKEELKGIDSFGKKLEIFKKYAVYIALLASLIIIAVLLFKNNNTVIIDKKETSESALILLDTIVKDYDGNSYQIISVNGLRWIASNLKNTHYQNGELIPNLENNTVWMNTHQGALSSYNNNNLYKDKFGLLYNWHAVNDKRNICPKGWRTPTYDEIKSLAIYLETQNKKSGALKSLSTWNNPNVGAENYLNFNALPGGKRWFRDGKFEFENAGVYYWTSSEKDNANAYFYAFSFDSDKMAKYYFNKNDGFYCRCVEE
jgi:uncharacterized protein (TIGR02145 family)